MYFLGVLAAFAVPMAFLALLVFWLMQLIDVAKRDEADFTAAGQSRVGWVLIVLLVPILGAVIYRLAARPRFA